VRCELVERLLDTVSVLAHVRSQVAKCAKCAGSRTSSDAGAVDGDCLALNGCLRRARLDESESGCCGRGCWVIDRHCYQTATVTVGFGSTN